MAGGVNNLGLLNSIERFSISKKEWNLLQVTIPHQLQDLSLHCLTPHQLLIFGGSNPEIETQYVYKIEILKNNSFLVSEMNTNFNDKSCIFQNKILVFGVL